MKPLTIFIFFLIAATGCRDKSLYESEFERGAEFVWQWHYKYKEYPSMYARRKAFENPELSMDSIYKFNTVLNKIINSYKVIPSDTLVPGIHRSETKP